MSVERYFTEDEYLPSVLNGYRKRSSQIEMAEVIASSLEEYKDALIEAPTGSGKSISYLISAFDSKRKIIISTKTKQLMSQLLDKDIPTTRLIFGDSYRVAKLMGRKNYLCPYRFYKFIMPNVAYYSDIVDWYETRKDDPFLQTPYGLFEFEQCNLMSADRYQCRYSKCEHYDNCPFYLAKDEANRSDMIITNHHLLLSDVALKAKDGVGSIFDYRDHIVFDEAHSLPDIYSEYAGVELALFSIPTFFRENNASFQLQDIDNIEKAYFEILKKVEAKGDDKLLYSFFEEDFKEFVALAKAIVEDKKSELKEEFYRYVALFAEIEKATDGIKFVERHSHHIKLTYTPFDISESFMKGVKRVSVSQLFVSATLSVKGDFAYFIKEVGLKDDVNKRSLKATFDYKKQSRVYVANAQNNAEKDSLYIGFIERLNGSVLIIVNSISRMRDIYELLKATIKHKKILAQDEVTISKLDLSEDIVLIGAAILREGIDLSRGDFRTVIIDKLPFEYPNDLFLKSKADRIESGGGNGFSDFFLPRAVLYFKQAIGRLIRHEDDIGAFLIFDDRIVKKRYGEFFKDAIKDVTVVERKDDIIKFVNSKETA